MRFLGSALLLGLLLAPAASHADPAKPLVARRPVAAAEDTDHVRFGVSSPWSPKHWRHLGFGVGWSLPQRWYDADGQLLTERSLLNPGDDLERSGLYLALRF